MGKLLRMALLALLLSVQTIAARPATATQESLQTRQWDAQWVDVPGTDPQAFGVCLFRRTLDLAAEPEHFPVLVSADNRYKLFVNGVQVSLGPARCDIEHWNYETVDLAPHLHPGANVVAAMVWNEGPGRAEAQFSLSKRQCFCHFFFAK